jgi:hypothetical protein
MTDDLGYGDLGCYGQKLIKTPRIDRMAAKGMRFRHFYTGCTVCAPSRSVLMTGQHMGHTHVRGNASVDMSIQSLRTGDMTADLGEAEDVSVGHPTNRQTTRSLHGQLTPRPRKLETPREDREAATQTGGWEIAVLRDPALVLVKH